MIRLEEVRRQALEAAAFFWQLVERGVPEDIAAGLTSSWIMTTQMVGKLPDLPEEPWKKDD